MVTFDALGMVSLLVATGALLLCIGARTRERYAERLSERAYADACRKRDRTPTTD